MGPIFLLSLPRSGSTLLQRMLATHPSISTASEPWLLLPFVYSLRGDGVTAEYNHRDMAQAFEDFCAQLPNGRADYYEAIKNMALELYTKSSTADSRYFLDKTPRYHLIVDDLIQIFPDAKFIILWRNPVAVAASMMETWSRGKWNLYHFEVDLYSGVSSLCSAVKSKPTQFHTLRFEDLVENPDTEKALLLDFLELADIPEADGDFSNIALEGRMGDPTGIKEYKKVSTDSLQKWQSTMANPWRKTWAARYLDWIGEENLALMGYQLNDLQGQLSQIKIGTSNLLSDAVRVSYGVVRAKR